MATRGIDVLTQAFKRIGSSLTNDQRADYTSRAPYLLATLCSEAKELDAKYREACELDAAPDFNEVEIDPVEEFPLCERFVGAASAYLAAMFIIDDNIELSDKFFDIYCDNMARIQSEIPTKLESIAQKYL